MSERFVVQLVCTEIDNQVVTQHSFSNLDTARKYYYRRCDDLEVRGLDDYYDVRFFDRLGIIKVHDSGLVFGRSW